RLNGIPIAADGTYRDYCDVIRTSAESQPIAIEVLRFDTEEFLFGELNSGKVLQQKSSFAEPPEESPSDNGGSGGGSSSVGYVTVTDDTGSISLDAPTSWVASTTPEDGGIPSIVASSDVAGYLSSWTTPGVALRKVDTVIPVDEGLEVVALETGASNSCTTGVIEDYTDGLYTGKAQKWENCGGTGSTYVVIVAHPDDGSPYTLIFSGQWVNQADEEAVLMGVGTFRAME
ncbi:MAG: hypothetical protein LBB54_00545, partial [Cellulomonadaceae bacterium]|nr:hypothetical protein [Cellulomonadaceae bacterium]